MTHPHPYGQPYIAAAAARLAAVAQLEQLAAETAAQIANPDPYEEKWQATFGIPINIEGGMK